MMAAPLETGSPLAGQAPDDTSTTAHNTRPPPERRRAALRPTHLVKALRLPFTAASVLPYLTGALLAPTPWRPLLLALGLIAVAGTHLSANVINDYADARSGVDALDPTCFGFFGGSKLIQQGILPARFFLLTGLGLAALSATAALLGALLLKQPHLFLVFLLVWTAGWAYSCPPAALVYRGLGELTIFLLFGLATTCAGYILQTGRLTPDAILLGLPHGFLVAGILIANEVPDAPDDERAGKRTLVVRAGAERGCLLYALAAILAAVAMAVAVARAILPLAGLLAIPAALLPAAAAAGRLRASPADKQKLVKASKLAIAAHVVSSLVIIMTLLPGKGPA
jgi:1,4-dihydroxy-2-naphthoate octaprenyltransferase